MSRALAALLLSLATGPLVAAPLAAQPAPALPALPSIVTPAAAATATPAPAVPPARPRLVRRSPRLEEMPRSAEPIPLLGGEQGITTALRPAGEAAPVPNRDIEAPVNRNISMEAKLVPEVFRRQMPGRGMTAEGLSSQREERVYAPAPGARLLVPFITR